MVPWPAIRAESNGRVPDRERYLVRGGTYLTTVGGTSWSDVGLTASTLYSYTVAARDAAGNVSSQSSSAAATTGPASVTTTYTYDANGNQLSASDGTLTINATYDRLNRPLTVDDEDPGTTADTTYTYSLTSPSWTDPTGTYAVGLDRLDHATSVDGPAIAAVTRTYRADGRIASQVDPNGNTTAFSFDALGRELSRTTTAAGPVTRASLVRTYNRAGQVLTENSQISGDPTNGTTTYTYDPLERLTSAARSGMSTLAYTWDEVPNRLSVQTGAGAAVPTTYDAANRPTGQNGVSNVFSSDADGRLTAQPTAAGAAFQTYEWDSLGRLTRVRDAAGTTTIATYTYDPLDRLRMVDYGSSNRVRFRYVGLTTNAAQTIDDASGLVLRNIGTDWTGERMLDWTGTNSNIRYLGTNAHHDTVWTASSTGTVSATLRYDPFGTLTSSTGSTPDFRFQGSWFDSASSLSWVVTRWYAPALGRFLSEDSLLGTPNDPPSRHLYAYAAGEPIGRWDPDGHRSTRLVARLRIHDPPKFVLNSLTLDLTWQLIRTCCVGIWKVTAVSWKVHADGAYYGLGVWWPGWTKAAISEGGLGKSFVGVVARSEFYYGGIFNYLFLTPNFHNTLRVSIYAKASGAAGCGFSWSFDANPAGFLSAFPGTCQYA